MQLIHYQTLERIVADKPVDRLEYVSIFCKDKVVLDLGCYDETALSKIGTEFWMHGRILNVAKAVIGVDSSDIIPDNGLSTNSESMIYKGDVLQIPDTVVNKYSYDVIVAGELIEHLENPLSFLVMIKQRFPGKKLLLTTPNAIGLANFLMGVIGREAQHKDHLANFTYKILNTLCVRAGYRSWAIKPYRFYATEILLDSKGLKKVLVVLSEKVVRFMEWLFP